MNQDGTDSDFEEKNTRTNEREVGSSVKVSLLSCLVWYDEM